MFCYNCQEYFHYSEIETIPEEIVRPEDIEILICPGCGSDDLIDEEDLNVN